MSQTWENAQRRGVVTLGATATGALGQQYQRAAYLAEQGGRSPVAALEADPAAGESSTAGFSWLPYHAPAPSSIASAATRRAGGR